MTTTARLLHMGEVRPCACPASSGSMTTSLVAE
jgi:hypothetical protein